MTNRVRQPDTDADLALRAHLDSPNPSAFIMVAGAGSGKTTSLVKALDYLSRSQGPTLQRRGQQIACITYTEIAVGEIWGDVGNAPLFHVSTIHSFLWSVVRPFQPDIRNWVAGRLREKIEEAETRLANPRTRAATRPRLAEDITRYRRHIDGLGAVKRFSYGTGSDYAEGVLGHSDILKLASTLMEASALLRKVVAGRFPFIFVDESQDTNPEVVSALKAVAATEGVKLCLGFFGDPMQKIYATGAGAIQPEDGWDTITKPENFRCARRVLDLVNRVRADGDGLVQTRGRHIEVEGRLVPVEGTARLFICPADDRRTERVAEVRRWLADTNRDPLWLDGAENADVRILVLVHRMAAQRLGFPDLYCALQDHGDNVLKDGLIDGSAWVLRPFLATLLPLVDARLAGNDFKVLSILREACPALAGSELENADIPATLRGLNDSVGQVSAMLESPDATIGQVLEAVRAAGLMKLEDRFERHLSGATEVADDDVAEAVAAFLACPARQLFAYRTYIEDQSPFATQQGVKGAEFQRVVVVIDDEEGAHFQFSYGKYFGITELSERDQENIAAGTDSVVSRTRRLFYVCCSRAEQDLAVVLFVPDVVAAHAAVLAQGLFPAEDVHMIP